MVSGNHLLVLIIVTEVKPAHFDCTQVGPRRRPRGCSGDGSCIFLWANCWESNHGILGAKKILKPETYDLCIYVIGFMI